MALKWCVKLPAISLITVAVSLITYDLFVRSTCLGSLLNGQRRSRVLWRSATPVQAREYRIANDRRDS